LRVVRRAMRMRATNVVVTKERVVAVVRSVRGSASMVVSNSITNANHTVPRQR